MNKTYLIEFANGRRQKVTVPEDWKVTFGPAAAGVNKERNGYKMPLAIRFYESKEKQRAIFTDVVSFRDMSISIEEERVESKTKIGQMEIDGMRKNVNLNAHVRSWINPDDEDELNAPAISMGDFEID